ncbi:hypothetical protein HMPREF2738_03423 [Clostridiales bacterium KLE1615]|nr:hypothetical protein HMPREF2738_03423 [Clostridiales bacterium KLE1615]
MFSFFRRNKIIFAIFIEEYCGKARRTFVTLRMNSNKKVKIALYIGKMLLQSDFFV